METFVITLTGTSVAIDTKSRKNTLAEQLRVTEERLDAVARRIHEMDDCVGRTRNCRSSGPGGEDPRRQCWLHERRVCDRVGVILPTDEAHEDRFPSEVLGTRTRFLGDSLSC